MADQSLEVLEVFRTRPLGKPNGTKWRVTLLEEGVSKNNKYYSGPLIQESARLFEGIQARIDHPGRTQLAERPEGSMHDLAGFYENVQSVQGDDGRWRLDADFNVVDPTLQAKMLRLWESGRPDLIGFSIHARATGFDQRKVGNQLVEGVRGFDLVRAVDVVTIAGAGGRLREVLESLGEVGMDENEIEIAGFTPEQMAGLNTLVESASSAAAAEAVEGFRNLLLEAAAEYEDDEEYDEDEDEEYEDDEDFEEDDEDDEDYDEEDEEDEALMESLRDILGRQDAEDERVAALEINAYHQYASDLLESAVAEANLPEILAGQALDRGYDLIESGLLDDDRVGEIIESQRAVAAQLFPRYASGTPAELHQESGMDQYRNALRATFGEEGTGEQPFRTLKEAFYHFPGTEAGQFDISARHVFNALHSSYDSEVHGDIMESVSTATFGDLFADVMHKRVAKIFSELPYNSWRSLVTEIASPTDFKDHHWVRMGMYDNVPLVLEGAPYQPLTTPGDEKATYNIAKYGGLEDLTLEAIANDDLGQLKRIPRNMAYAVVRTLYESVMDTATTGGLTGTTTYDAYSLYHTAQHANRGTAALTPVGVDATQVAMRLQVPYGAPATEFIGVRNKIKTVIVSPANERRAEVIFNPSSGFQPRFTAVPGGASDTIVRDTDEYTGIDPLAFAGKGVNVLVYDKLAASGNNNWYAVADPSMVDTLVVGFLNGRQEPELFVQDESTRAGAAFSADKITYKVRMFWGVGTIDHRGMYVNELA